MALSSKLENGGGAGSRTRVPGSLQALDFSRKAPESVLDQPRRPSRFVPPGSVSIRPIPYPYAHPTPIKPSSLARGVPRLFSGLIVAQLALALCLLAASPRSEPLPPSAPAAQLGGAR